MPAHAEQRRREWVSTAKTFGVVALFAAQGSARRTASRWRHPRALRPRLVSSLLVPHRRERDRRHSTARPGFALCSSLFRGSNKLLAPGLRGCWLGSVSNEFYRLTVKGIDQQVVQLALVVTDADQSLPTTASWALMTLHEATWTELESTETSAEKKAPTKSPLALAMAKALEVRELEVNTRSSVAVCRRP